MSNRFFATGEHTSELLELRELDESDGSLNEERLLRVIRLLLESFINGSFIIKFFAGLFCLSEKLKLIKAGLIVLDQS